MSRAFPRSVRTTTLAALTLAALVCAAPAQENPLQNGPAWDDLKDLVLKGAAPTEDAQILTLEAPVRAVDPAFVPVHLTQAPGSPPLTSVTVVIDENPAPVAAEIALGPAMSPLDLEVRMRVNAYSNVRAVATTDNSSIMAGRYVKATGGCAAPASKDIAAMLAEMGQMRFQVLSSQEIAGRIRHTAKLMIRHPNTTGFQRDQVTLMTVPAHFIDRLEVRQGDDLLFSVVAGISISEDPVFQFSFADNGQDTISVHAEDTDGNVFDQTFALTGL